MSIVKLTVNARITKEGFTYMPGTVYELPEEIAKKLVHDSSKEQGAEILGPADPKPEHGKQLPELVREETAHRKPRKEPEVVVPGR